MKLLRPLIYALLLVFVFWVWTKLPLTAQTPPVEILFTELAARQTLTPTPIFLYPAVPDAEISGYFDHDPASQKIIFFDGRASQPENGFSFACPDVGGAWVGCVDSAGNETECKNERELWYDNHRGIDFEYSVNWHTGPMCDLARFGQIDILIYAPTAGIVDFVGENDPYNGNYVRLYHDLDGDDDYYNDGVRSYYLHFASDGILVDEGDVLAAGDPLGYGGATGLAWTPHLHFEVQKRTDIGWVSVDPFGWFGPEEDPWHVPNHFLWQESQAVP
jgi:murein DD-endopeptidase MepM/ murein hydrolase activator NlpD